MATALLPKKPASTVGTAPFNDRTRQLLDRLTVDPLACDELDERVAAVQRALQGGSSELAGGLAAFVRDPQSPTGSRCIALEAFAGARVPEFADLVAQLISECLASSDPDLRFTAVAATADLPRERRAALTEAIRNLAGEREPDSNVRAAATAFLRAVAA